MRLFQIKRSVLFTISTTRVAAAADVPGYTFGDVDAAFLEDPVFAVRERRTRYAERFTAGHRCFGFHDATGAIAAYFWFTVAATIPVAVPWELGAEVFLPPQTAYVWDCFTAPAHRRRGLYVSGILRLVARGHADGAVTVVIVSRSENIASRAGIIAAGFTAAGEHVTVKCGRHLRIYRLRCIRPYREPFVLGAAL